MNSYHYQCLITHHKSRIKSRKVKGFLSEKTKNYLKLISHSLVIYLNHVN